jgi:Fe-S cluster assembly protein SufD
MAETVTSAFEQHALERLATNAGDGGNALRLRQEAYQRYELMPLPSPETEEWRYTDVSDLDLASFSLEGEEPQATTLDDIPAGLQEAMGDVGDRAGLAVQHNSTLTLAHLEPELDRAGVHFESIDAALRDHPQLVEGRLHAAVPFDRTKFTALHAAFRTGGTFVHVPKGVKVELPLQTFTYVDRDGLAVFPHTVLVVEEGAEVTYIDRYTSPDLERVLSNAIVEIYAGPGAKVRYVALQDWGSGVTHLAVQRAIVDKDADVRTLAVAFGASLSRMEAETLLQGNGGSSEMLGVYFGDADKRFDFRSIQDHVGNDTASDLLYKGALKGESSAIYSGTVIIQAGAHRCNAYQTNRNVLLTETAKAFSIPNLEILTNDPVRCGHAASVGPVDEDTLFYIQSRGIPAKEAERLLVFGFFREVLDRVSIPEVQASVEATIERELEGN